MSRNPRMVGERVLVENVKASDNVGGIYVPEAHRERHTAEAVVVSVGGRVDVDAGGRKLATGDRVFTERHAGQHVTVAGRPMRILAPNEILALVTT